MDTIQKKRIVAQQCLKAINNNELVSQRSLARLSGLSRPTIKRIAERVSQCPEQFENIHALRDSELISRLKTASNPIVVKEKPDVPFLLSLMKKHGLDVKSAYGVFVRNAKGPVYSLSHVYDEVNRYQAQTSSTMLLHYHPGQVVFVDFAGKRPVITDAKTGTKKKAELFVGILGYSGLTYFCACHTQNQQDWIAVNKSMLDYFGGVPEYIVPDNLKAAVIKSGKEPKLNPLYEEFGLHYATGIIPARTYHPQDKARVENAVRQGYRYILSRLTGQTFFSIDELNDAIKPLMDEFNNKAFAKFEGSRRSWFEENECEVLSALPDEEFVVWSVRKPRKVDKTYHILYEGHYYSVPHQLIGKTVLQRVSDVAIRFSYDNETVAEHLLSNTQNAFSTTPTHMPSTHRAYASLNKRELLDWAVSVGPATTSLIDAQYDGLSETAPNVKNRCAKFKKLAEKWGNIAFENAASVAMRRSSPSLRLVSAIIKSEAGSSRGEQL